MKIEDLLPDRFHAAGHWLRENFPPVPFQRQRLQRKLAQHPPLVIFQMGKVGSRAIYYGIKPRYPGVTLHSHNYCADDANWKTRAVFDQSHERSQPVKFISLTRDPISLNVSAFFQNFHKITGQPYRQTIFSGAELKDLFLEKHTHNMPLRWFDRKLNPATGIDVYQTEFPSEGHKIYARDNIRLLVLRSELEDDEKVAVVSDFLNIKGLKLDRTNTSKDKSYGEDYRRFCEQTKLPREYLQRLCDSKYFTHFYEPSYIQSTYEKWSAV